MAETYTITTMQNDTVFDIAMQEYGQAMGLFQLILDNPLLFSSEYTPILAEGTVINISYIPTHPEVKQSLVDYARSLKV